MNNTIGEREVVKHGDALYGAAVDLVRYGARPRRAPAAAKSCTDVVIRRYPQRCSIKMVPNW